MRKSFVFLLLLILPFAFQNCGQMKPVAKGGSESQQISQSGSESSLSGDTLVSIFDNLSENKVSEILQQIQSLINANGGALSGFNIITALNIFLGADLDVSQFSNIVPSELCDELKDRYSSYQNLVDTAISLMPSEQGQLLTNLVSECGQ